MPTSPPPTSFREPQAILKLSPTGGLAMELPGRNGMREVIDFSDLSPMEIVSCIERRLKDQMLDSLAAENYVTRSTLNGKSYEQNLELFINKKKEARRLEILERGTIQKELWSEKPKGKKPTKAIDLTLDLI